MSKNKHFLSILLAGSLLCLSVCGNQAAENLFAEEKEAENAADSSPDNLFSDTENLFVDDAENAVDGSPGNLFADTENLFAEDAAAENIPHGSIVRITPKEAGLEQTAAFCFFWTGFRSRTGSKARDPVHICTG